MTRQKQNVQKELEFFNSFGVDEKTSLFQATEIFNLVMPELDKLNLKGLGLEGGCALGFIGEKLTKTNKNISIIGVDINKKFIDRINIRKPIRYKGIHGNLEKNGLFKKDTFDFIFLPYVLHHIPNVKQIIKNVERWLKQGGTIVIVEPNGSNLILNLSYKIRLFLSRIFPTWGVRYASLNEKNIPLDKFNDLFNGSFEVLDMKSFLFDSKLKYHSSFDKVVKILVGIRKLLLKFYGSFFPSKYTGSEILIVVKKLPEK